MFILKILEGKFLRDKGQQEVCKKCCSKSSRKVVGRNGVSKSEWATKQQCGRAVQQVMNWLVLTVHQHHHSCCRGQRIRAFPKASRGIEVTAEIHTWLFLCLHPAKVEGRVDKK